MSAGVQSGAPHGHGLQGSAASAALYVTRDTPSSQTSHSILDEDGRLSAASAATSLKHARAQDLPSFPSQGGVKLSSAGAAASLANENHKPFEHWKPDSIPAANKAAVQAKDYKMSPQWQPELSAAGSKAALQAHGNTSSPVVWRAPESEHGLSAAGQAHASRKPTKPITEREVSASDHRKALLAATGAMSAGRKRSDSAPVQPQVNPNAGWALKAAASTHKTANPRGEFAGGDPGFEAARIQNIAKSNVSKQMYGSTPPVSIEVEEKNRQDMLRASAIAMAQKMYAIQQSHIDDARGNKLPDSTSGARAARNRAMSDASSSLGSDPTGRGYENLQEAATRLAQEKLAKLHDEHADYRSYYGQTRPPKNNRLSVRGHRRRASSNNEDSDSDEEQSRKIRSQMSLFQSRLAEVDTKKRQADRDALLQAAHKNVTAQLNKMDEQVFSETGKASPQQRELWERQARERAQRESDDRMVNVGRVHIGGGKYLDQADIDAIAKQRLQPTLDEIADKAEKQRAKDEELRLEQEKQKQEQETEKQRQADIKKELKESQAREKQEERGRRDEEKRANREEASAAKEKRQAEAAADKEKARQDREEKRKSQGKKPGFFSGVLARGAGATAAGSVAVGGAGVAATTTAANAPHPTTSGTEHEATDAVEHHPTTIGTEHEATDVVEHETYHDQVTERPATADSIEADASPQVTSPEESSRKVDDIAVPTTPAAEKTPFSPNKRDSRIKTFFGRFRSKSHSAEDENFDPFKEQVHPSSSSEAKKSTEADGVANGEIPRSDSMRDVALAGRKTRESDETEDMYGDAAEHQEPDSPVSPIKETATDNPVTAAPASAASPTARDRSPSISSLSSSGDDPPFAAGEATSPTTDDASRGRKGLRQRLLKKVKPSSGGGVAIPGKSKLSKTKDKDQRTDSNAGAFAAATTTTSTSKPTGSSEKQQADAAPQIASETGVSKKSQDTEEREEARDAFKEEVTLAPPPKLADARGESPRGSREGSRFHEEL